MQILKKETYLKTIENAEGSRLFNSLFVRNEGTPKRKIEAAYRRADFV